MAMNCERKAATSVADRPAERRRSNPGTGADVVASIGCVP